MTAVTAKSLQAAYRCKFRVTNWHGSAFVIESGYSFTKVITQSILTVA